MVRIVLKKGDKPAEEPDLTKEGMKIKFTHEHRDGTKSTEEGMTSERLVAIMETLPADMDIAKMIALTVNIMVNYDMLRAAPTFLRGMMVVLEALQKEHPELFSEGGRDSVAENLLKALMEDMKSKKPKKSN